MARKLLAIATMALVFATTAMARQSAAFHLSFEQGFKTSSGNAPTEATRIAFVPGKIGEWAGTFGSGAVLTYSTQDAYNPTRGTLDLWVQPQWNASGLTGNCFFWGANSDPGTSNRTVLGFLGREGKGVVHFGDDGALSGVSAAVDWREGEWHHLAVCWDAELHCRALYIDGQRRHAAVWDGGMPSAQEVFHIGSLPCITRWSGAELGHEAHAAIDDVKLYHEVIVPDFADVAREVAQDLEARQRYEDARTAARPGFEEAFRRLHAQYTLDSVAAEGIEVGWDDLLGVAAPLSKRIPIQARYHPHVVFLGPDLSLSLGRSTESWGIGSGLAEPFALPDTYSAEKSLDGGYRPVVIGKWGDGSVEIRQTAFTLLPEDDETVTGRETEYVVVRFEVTNAGADLETRPFLLLLGNMGGRHLVNYGPFLDSAGRWMTPPLDARLDGHALLIDDRVFLTYRADEDEQAQFLPRMKTGVDESTGPAQVTNVLRFDWALHSGEIRTVDLVMASAFPGFSADERSRMENTDFGPALEQARTYWEKGLEPGMKLTTPDARLNSIYRVLILSSLANMTKNAERPWREPNQAPMWEAVWPWEFVHMAVPLAAVGYHRELVPAYRFLTERQTGVGPYAVEDRGPEGDIVTRHGCYTTNFLLRWMAETGTVLWGMAAQYQYSRDVAWLKENRESILAAWDWIQCGRQRTKRFEEDGERVAYYGLLPKGRVHDRNEWRYHFTFTDAFTWKGMHEMAAAFRDAGLPDADRLEVEAEDYRRCILDVVDRVQYVDPETGLLFIPNDVFHEPGEPPGNVWWADGPTCLFATGLLDARTDSRFEPMVEYMQQHFGTLMGIVGPMDQYQDVSEKGQYWYVNCPERGLFKNYLARGEIEKALLLFYSTLVYGLSHDCYQTVERIHIWDRNYAPFQPNASGNGRLLDMMKRMVIDEQEPGVLWLLRGCPRRWFADGQSITVEDAPTRFGSMNLQTHATRNVVTIEVDCPARDPADEIKVALRHPSRAFPAAVTVNGKRVAAHGETVIIGQPSGRTQIVATYASQE